MGLLVVAGVMAQSTISPHDRLRGEIAEGERVVLPGNVHPALAHAQSDAPVDPSFPMEHMILLLQPDSTQLAALDQLVAQQHDSHSPQYHQFLTPAQYAERFGVSQNDIDKITGWLTTHGFQVEEVTPNHLSIVFSGDALRVQTAFNTEVRQYSVNGQIHYANASDPQIPAALSSVVKGVVKLHDFQARSFSQGSRVVGDATNPMYTASPTTHYVGPADWTEIYDVRPLYQSNLNGTGQTIAVVGRSDVKLSDIEAFRTQFGLTPNNPITIVAQGSDPGFTNSGDSTEATLDVEWAGAIAPNVQVKFVVAASTATADGIALAASYAVNRNVAPVLSVSYGACEAEMGMELAFYNSLWQQAASEGMSVFVAAGDSGAAGCDSPGTGTGTARAVNGICTSPYVTCVGGTEFNEGSNASQYWVAGNNSILGTAQSYIPEVVWNESGSNKGSGLAAGGGGASIQYTKPTWQNGVGVPADGHRDVPDIALTAASHDGYLIFYNGNMMSVGGTSAATPSFASLFTMVNQHYSSTQGNASPTLYLLALKQSQGGAAIFHDITSGNNTVPGVTGYAAAVGYDLASGLGSVDGAELVAHWHDVSLNGTFTITAAPSTVSLQGGQSASAGLNFAVNNGFNWPIALTVSGLPAGIATTLSKTLIPAPGSGTATLQFNASTAVTSGSYPVTVTATGGGMTQTATIALTVTAIVPKCSLTANPTSIAMPSGQGTNVRLTCISPQGALPASLSLAVSGQPAGLTTALSSTTLVPGTGTTTLTVNTAVTTAPGSYNLAVTASGGAYSQTINVPVTLVVTPKISLTLSSSSVSVVQGTMGTLQATVAAVGTFSASTILSVSGLPAGMTGSLSPAGFAAPGAGVSTLTLQPSTSTPVGKYTINVVAAGGGLQQSSPITLTVTAAPNFSFTATQAGSSIQAGQSSGSVALTVSNLTNGFNAPVNLSVAGLPTGVTGTFSSATLAAPGTGTSTLTLNAASTVVAGQYKLIITATGGAVSNTISNSVTYLLTVIGLPGFTLKTNVSSLALVAGASFSSTVSVVEQNSFNSPVTLTVGALPAGVTATLSSNTISGPNGTATLTVQTATTLAAGTYPITLSGASTVITTPLPSQTATIAVTVGTVASTLSATSLAVKRGSTASVTVNETSADFTGGVSFSASGNPAFVSYSFSPNALSGSGSTTLTISATASATPNNTFTLMVRTSAGGITSQTPLTVSIQ